MAGRHHSLDRFSLNVDGKVDQGVRMTIDLDLNTVAEEMVDRLNEDDLIDFVVGLIELYGDLDTTQAVLGRLSDLRATLEQEALEAESLMDRHG